MMRPSIRKIALATHVTASVGWIGALAVFFAHGLAGLLSENPLTIRATSIAMGLTAWLVIAPLSAATLISGLVQALGTPWGLLRHYWIIFKLLLTAVATAVLLLKLEPIDQLAQAARQAAFLASDLAALRTSLALHAAGGLVVLLAALVLAIYKPEGRTNDARLPRWVKIAAMLAAALFILIGVMMLFGAHGPGAHVSRGS